MLAAFVSVPAGIGYVGVFLLVGGETAGALLPGETALIVAGALAARGDLSLPLVIGAAAAGAIAGDNIGFLVGERGVRLLLTRGERWRRQRAWLVAEAERFFARYGPRAVFLARWVPGLRLIGAWFAGAARMRWRVFLVWNALGGIAWAASVGGGAYLLGRAANWAFGLVGLVLTVTLLILAGVVLARRRLERASSAAKCGSSHPTQR
ncbi:MAG: DedA family protein [Acidobacteriota bacterium]|nr:DedA family protein [Acidobacteriota bacterium]